MNRGLEAGVTVARPARVRVVFNEVVYCMMAIVLTVFRFAGTRLTRPRLNHDEQDGLANRAGPSLDNSDSDEEEVPRKRSRHEWHFTMSWDWRWFWTELGTVIMALCIAENSMQMIRHSFERAVHVHLALGLSKGFALLVIVFIILFQVAATAGLMVPVLYLTTGSIAPSAILAGAVWFEAFLFGDVTDMSFCIRCAALSATTAMLALFRFDRQARNSMAQLPTSGTLLNVEAVVRRVCTSLRTGLVLPPAGFLLLAISFYNNPFWRTHGIVYEWYRGRFQAAAAVAALMFLVAGQDTRAHTFLVDRVERVYDAFMRRKEDLLGQPRAFRGLGAKKEL